MKRREHSSYERYHLRHPVLLERLFHKRTIWMIAAVVLAIVMLWAAIILILDIITNRNNTPIDLLIDFAVLAAIPLMVWVGVQEGLFYQRTVWQEAEEIVISPADITVEDIHMTLDCDGMTAEEITEEDSNKVYESVAKIIIREFGVESEVARDFTKHFVDEEDAGSPEEYFIDNFRDAVQHVNVDKNL